MKVSAGMLTWQPKRNATFNYGVPASEIMEFEVIRKPYLALMGVCFLEQLWFLYDMIQDPSPFLGLPVWVKVPLFGVLVAMNGVFLIWPPPWHWKMVRLRMRDGSKHELRIRAPLESLIEAKEATTAYRDTSGEGWLSPTADGAVSLHER